MQNTTNSAWAGSNSIPTNNTTWGNGQISNTSNPWGPIPGSTTWATNNQTQPPPVQPQTWSWPQMGQAGGDGWNGNIPSNGGDQMWNNWCVNILLYLCRSFLV